MMHGSVARPALSLTAVRGMCHPTQLLAVEGAHHHDLVTHCAGEGLVKSGDQLLANAGAIVLTPLLHPPGEGPADRGGAHEGACAGAQHHAAADLPGGHLRQQRVLRHVQARRL